MRQGGPCLSNIPMFYYDPRYRTCRHFIYRGCGGNNNRFSSKEECMSECGEEDSEESEEEEEFTDPCTLPMVKGFCRNEVWRWYYDFDTYRCKRFKYTGCLGNANNFATYRECASKCLEE
ncbi:tissue factor pathway inhibitor [Trichonephila inaurata madagascariensis]|uniref:Tissue factor pathway inhibitor n=2 Tax=Trichonephila inaurata madagascariensis TaxID=2747483 RepID=A0A8X6XPU3_9ARAC|nr:tissue factor pathway inhibitor [Trichonephila inaurata madagascariensis]